MILILLIDAEPALAEELRAAFSQVEGFALVLSSGSEQLPTELAALRPDVILLDSPSALVADSISIWQHVAPFSRIVVWARSVSPEFAFKAIRLGVRGVLLRTASIASVLRCLTKVSEGEIWLDKALFDNVTPTSGLLLHEHPGR